MTSEKHLPTILQNQLMLEGIIVIFSLYNRNYGCMKSRVPEFVDFELLFLTTQTTRYPKNSFGYPIERYPMEAKTRCASTRPDTRQICTRPSPSSHVKAMEFSNAGYLITIELRI